MHGIHSAYVQKMRDTLNNEGISMQWITRNFFGRGFYRREKIKKIYSQLNDK